MTLTKLIGRFLSDRTKRRVYDGRQRLLYEQLRMRTAHDRGQEAADERLILFHPEIPMHEHTIFKMAALAGHRMTRRTSSDFDVAVRFEDATDMTMDDRLAELARGGPVINMRCDDISKSKVNEVFGEVFGYEIGIDPTTYTGIAVVKSEINAKHDGREAQCPIERQPGMSYQRLVNTLTPDGQRAVVLRVVIIGRSVAMVFRKLRPAEGHLTDADLEAIQHPTDDVFSAQEQAHILDFCDRLGLDMGEIDILRDNEDGRIYIVDANCTPWGPPLPIIDDGREPAVLAELAPAYEALFDRFSRRAKTPVGAARH